MTTEPEQAGCGEPPGEPPRPKWWEFAAWWAVENCGEVVLTLVGGALCGLLGWWLWAK